MNDGGTGTTDDIIQGIERAIQDGADVLNLSLGQDLNVPDQPVTLTLERNETWCYYCRFKWK